MPKPVDYLVKLIYNSRMRNAEYLAEERRKKLTTRALVDNGWLDVNAVRKPEVNKIEVKDGMVTINLKVNGTYVNLAGPISSQDCN